MGNQAKRFQSLLLLDSRSTLSKIYIFLIKLFLTQNLKKKKEKDFLP
jgi:hypothetical protein